MQRLMRFGPSHENDTAVVPKQSTVLQLRSGREKHSSSLHRSGVNRQRKQVETPATKSSLLSDEVGLSNINNTVRYS